MTATPRSRRKPAPEKIETRDQLLAAASALMTERNTTDVSTGDVAAKAGVNAALVNYYFKTKTGMWVELVRRDAKAALADLDRLMALDLSPSDKLRRHIVGMIRTFHRVPYLHRLTRELLRDADSKSAREISEFFTQPVADAQSQMIRDGIERGEFRDIDPMMFYFAVSGACDHLFADSAAMRYLFGIKRFDGPVRERCAESVADLLINGCLK